MILEIFLVFVLFCFIAPLLEKIPDLFVNSTHLGFGVLTTAALLYFKMPLVPAVIFGLVLAYSIHYGANHWADDL